MVGAFSGGFFRPGAGSLVAKWLARLTPHPDAFTCGVRVLDGVVSGEGTRWRYRPSAVDPLVLDGVHVLNHGGVALHLMVDQASARLARGSDVRPGYALLRASEQHAAAQVELAVPVGELVRFGIGLE